MGRGDVQKYLNAFKEIKLGEENSLIYLENQAVFLKLQGLLKNKIRVMMK